MRTRIRIAVAGMAAVQALASTGSVAGGVGSWRDFPGVSNTSYVEANGDRAIQLSIDVPAPRQAVFDSFATTDGFKSWAVPVANIDLRIGGVIESNYNAAAKLGERDNIRNEIVAYLPGRMLVLRNVQAPRTFINPELFQKTVTVVEFASIDDANTRVTITNAGYGAGEHFDRIYRQFEWGDAYSLAELRQRFVKGPVEWSKPAAKVAAAGATRAVEGSRP